jgi:hypothetical protein
MMQLPLHPPTTSHASPGGQPPKHVGCVPIWHPVGPGVPQPQPLSIPLIGTHAWPGGQLPLHIGYWPGPPHGGSVVVVTGTDVVLVLVVLVVAAPVVLVVVAPGGVFAEGTQTSLALIVASSAGPNWLFMRMSTTGA